MVGRVRYTPLYNHFQMSAHILMCAKLAFCKWVESDKIDNASTLSTNTPANLCLVGARQSHWIPNLIRVCVCVCITSQRKSPLFAPLSIHPAKTYAIWRYRFYDARNCINHPLSTRCRNERPRLGRRRRGRTISIYYSVGSFVDIRVHSPSPLDFWNAKQQPRFGEFSSGLIRIKRRAMSAHMRTRNKCGMRCTTLVKIKMRMTPLAVLFVLRIHSACVIRCFFGCRRARCRWNNQETSRRQMGMGQKGLHNNDVNER